MDNFVAPPVVQKRAYKRKNVDSLDRSTPRGIKRNNDEEYSSLSRKSSSKRSQVGGIRTPVKKGARSLLQKGIKKQIIPGTLNSRKTSTKALSARNSLFNPNGIQIVDRLGDFARSYLQNPPRSEEPKKKNKLIEDSEWTKLTEAKRKYFELSSWYPDLKVAEDSVTKTGNVDELNRSELGGEQQQIQIKSTQREKELWNNEENIPKIEECEKQEDLQQQYGYDEDEDDQIIKQEDDKLIMKTEEKNGDEEEEDEDDDDEEEEDEEDEEEECKEQSYKQKIKSE